MRLLLLLVLLALAAPARGQAPDTTRPTVAVPVPEAGVLYLRRGAPGGVRIRSMGGRRIVLPPPRARSAPGVPLAPGGDRPATLDDLLRAEIELMDFIDRRLRALDQGAYPAPGSAPVVVGAGGPSVVFPLRRDSLGRPVLPEPSGLARPGVAAAGAQPRGTIRVRPELLAAQVERVLLETGLFRAVDVLFEFDEAALLPHGTATLDAVGAVLTRNPGLRLEVAGHTDGIGSAAYNERLSRARAEAVRAYLVQRHGVAPGRLTAVGYGETQPVASDATSTGRALNRRVEFRTR